MADETEYPTGETFTRAPEVEIDPAARAHQPVRANFPGEEPPQGLHPGDLGAPDDSEPHIRPALFGEPFDDPVAPGSVRCVACAHRCVLRPSRVGICGVRQNRGGRLYILVYGQVVASKAEPIEKKPFYHFLPGSSAYSVATWGCNFHCAYCQNWQMSQAHREGRFPESRYTPPDITVEQALADGVQSIAYTYVEPTIFIEYALDTMTRAHAAGLRNVFVTNGYESPEAIERLAGNLDAANVDLKGPTDKFYRRVCGARFEPVRDAILGMLERGIWLELTTLLIPGLNDDRRDLAALAEWIATAVGPETPWHVTRFQPEYKLAAVPETPAATLLEVAAIGREAGLRHVYVGNAPEVETAETCCARCGKLLIARESFRVTEWHLVNGRCPRCGHPLGGVGLENSPIAV